MTDTEREDAPPDGGEKQPLPSVPGHLQEAVQQLVRSNEPQCAGKSPSEKHPKGEASTCPATPSN